MFEILSFIQFVILGVMLSAASYQDIKKREISDLIWLSFGTAGAVITGTTLYLAPDLSTISAIIIPGLIALALFFLKLGGQADSLGLAAMSVIFPFWAPVGPVSMPFSLLVFAGGAILSYLYVIVANAYLNSKDLIRTKSLFSEMNDCLFTKAAAFFLVHRNRGEKFTFSGTANDRLRLSYSVNSDEFDTTSKYVQFAPPMLPFTLACSLALFLNKSLSVWD